jgi:hypothetical protein
MDVEDAVVCRMVVMGRKVRLAWLKQRDMAGSKLWNGCGDQMCCCGLICISGRRRRTCAVEVMEVMLEGRDAGGLGVETVL